MAYDEDLANRIRAVLDGAADVEEKRLFGGLAFLVNGNMSVAASGQGGLLLRCEPGQTAALAKKPHASPMVMRGRPMEGWLRVAAAGVKTDKGLAPWVKVGISYARSLPAKKAKKAKPARVAKRR